MSEGRARDAGDAADRDAPIRVAPLSRGLERRAADVLALAFRDGPISRAVVGESAAHRLRSNRHGAGRALRGTTSDSGGDAIALAATVASSPEDPDEGPHGVLIALPPGRYPPRPPSLGVQLWSGLVQGFRVASRWGEVYRAFDEVHPLEPHWYLSLVGVLPALQRRGIGRALVARWLEAVDRDAMPSYLETDRPGNVAFYATAGFDVARELDVLGTHVFCLWRPARGLGGAPDSRPNGPVGFQRDPHD